MLVSSCSSSQNKIIAASSFLNQITLLQSLGSSARRTIRLGWPSLQSPRDLVESSNECCMVRDLDGVPPTCERSTWLAISPKHQSQASVTPENVSLKCASNRFQSRGVQCRKGNDKVWITDRQGRKFRLTFAAIMSNWNFSQ